MQQSIVCVNILDLIQTIHIGDVGHITNINL